MLSFHVVSIISIRHQDLTIVSQTHSTIGASRFLLVRLNFNRSRGLVSAEYIVSLFGNFIFHEGSESGHEAKLEDAIIFRGTAEKEKG